MYICNTAPAYLGIELFLLFFCHQRCFWATICKPGF